MSAPNVGWVYYVDYFRQPNSLQLIDFHFLLAKNEDQEKIVSNALGDKCRRMSGMRLGDYSSTIDSMKLPGLIGGEDYFGLTTTYPGLLVGGGYQHEVHVDGEFKLGFFFDYTTGLPIIPGSSVKGVLRSAFKIEELMKELLPGRSETEIRGIEIEIFDGVDLKLVEPGHYDDKFKNKWKYLPMPKKDVFHDAIIVGSNNKGQKFLASDFITPHKNQFANPIPLQFMKVLPEVKFRFQFDVKKGASLDKIEKLKLFKEIIKTVGVGAKTRTGYGWMKDEEKDVKNKQERA